MAANTLNKKTVFDKAIGESDGNGGDFQLYPNDFAVVYGNENQVYLAFFGGNTEQVTGEQSVIPGQNFDYWANGLFHGNLPDRQFNSKTEKYLNGNTAADPVILNSAGRIRIENAAKEDLNFLKNMGVTFTVEVSIPETNKCKIVVKTYYPNGSKRMAVVIFGNTRLTGDFNPLDFNDDFF